MYEIAFARIYPLYIQKAEVDEVIAWLTGYSGKALERAIDNNIDLETFFAEAPRMNANAALPRRRSAPREPGTGEQG